MMRCLAIALVVLQLRPVAAAAACAMQTPNHVPCEMSGPSHGASGHGARYLHEQSSGPAQPGCECRGAPVCAVNSGLTVSPLTQALFPLGNDTAPLSIAQDSVHAPDPTAPPVPPPNS